MRKYAIASGILAVSGGWSGFFLRRLELQKAFEPDTGLPAAGNASTTAIIIYVFFILAVAAAVAILIRVRFEAKKTYREVFPPSGGQLVFNFAVCAAAVISGVLCYSEARGTELFRTQLLIAAMTALAGLALLGLAAMAMRERESQSKLPLVLAVIPELFFTVWLLILYRANQTNPIRLEYVFQALAMVSAAMAAYFNAGFVCARPAPARAVFSHAAAVFFLLTASADAVPQSQKLAFVAFASFFAVNLVRLMAGLIPRQPKAAESAPEVEPPAAETPAAPESE
ncbi:MAG: hypothetical protein LBH17_04680 [Oscillospiraceae bacterium]|jgi:hypothetical protein|nr:hypothetical protein [Oscillospiraceae bacterium]